MLWVLGHLARLQRTESSNFRLILKVLSLLLGFVTLWGFACFNKRTWGSSTSREGLFPVREICIHGSSNQNKKRALSPSGSAFHMTRQCLDAAGIFPHWSSSQRGDACELQERWQRAWSWCWGLLLCAPASTLCPPGTAVVDSTSLGTVPPVIPFLYLFFPSR